MSTSERGNGATSANRWPRVKQIVADALDHSTLEREEFVTTECGGDAELRREVDSLLQHSGDTGTLDAFASDLSWSRRERSDSTVGQTLGAYRVLREIGRGGMGAVYLGERADQAFKKQVAIKLLKRGTDTDEVLRRFQGEREILARLEHPNIAHIIDGGTSDDGLPFLVMEYVDGSRVTDFCADNRLTIPDRLRLFLKICAAVQFAHQNLVVHRDLKPANILVTADGEPKLLDFGIAKLLDPGDDAWQITLGGQERFTPGYAAPEQVRGDAVTTVSDVYAIGALLYEVLTGRGPHRLPTSAPTQTQIAQAICENDPIRPSNAATDPDSARQLRGDLDTILLRALAKQPERRYRSAGHLADDLRRYLEHRPVHARADTVGYRARKFLQRHTTATVAAALVLLSLLAAVFVSVRQARISDRERARADARFNDVREIANSLIFEIHHAIADVPGTLGARQLLAERALAYLDSLAREADDDLSLRSELVAAYQTVGQNTFNIEQSIETHRKSVALSEQLVQAAPGEVAYQKQLSQSYHALADMLKIAGRSQEAIAYAERSLAVLQRLASAPNASCEIRAQLAERYGAIAVPLTEAGDFRSAIEQSLKGIAVVEKVIAKDPSCQVARDELTALQARLSDAYLHAGDLARAMSCASQTMESARGNLAADPTNKRYRRDMWSAQFRLARQYAADGDIPAALENYEQAVGFLEALSEADPEDKGHRRWLAVTYSALGGALAKAGRTDEALLKQQRALAISEELAREDEARFETRRDLVKIHNSIGHLYQQKGESPAALESFGRAQALAEKLSEVDPANTRVRSAFAEALAGMATCHQALALEESSPPGDRAAHLRAAQQLFARSVAHWKTIETAGLVSYLDTGKPEIALAGVAACAEALRIE